MECEIKNPFHQTEHGCCFRYDEETQTFTHVFAKTRYSCARNGLPVSSLLTFQNTIVVNCDFNTHTAAVKCSPFRQIYSKALIGQQPDILSLEDYLTTSTLKSFIQSQLVAYFFHFPRHIRSYVQQNPELFAGINNHRDTDNRLPDQRDAFNRRFTLQSRHTPDTLNIGVKNFFDIYLRLNELGEYRVEMFRPVYFEFNFVNLCVEWRNALIMLFELVANKDEPSPDTDEEELFREEHTRDNDRNTTSWISCPSMSKRTYKRFNIRSCSLLKLLHRPAIHLRCASYVRKTNKDASKNTDSGRKCIHFNLIDLCAPRDDIIREFQKILDKKIFLCSRVLIALCDVLDENTVARLLKFTCLLSSAVVNVVNVSHGRCELLHATLCCSKEMMSSLYIESIFDIFNNKKNTNHNSTEL